MPRSDFGPEVKAGMQPKPKAPVPEREPASVAKQEAQMARDSSGNTGLPPPNKLPGPGRGGMPGMAHPGMPGAPDAHHVAAAASIAHAILGNRGLR